MRVFENIADWRRAREELGRDGAQVGFVPTMGALHAGHVSLLRRAREENDHAVMSIFVNPTQFNDPADLAKYPRTLAADLALVGELVDDVLAPAPDELYPDGHHYRVTEHELSRQLEGAHRPGHFDGVLTVVLKLLNLVQPHRAYFGEKDWQQLQLVQGMVKSFHLPVDIVACPTMREEDGLALSSRNARLSPAGRTRAARFNHHLRTSPDTVRAAAGLRAAGFDVDYVEDRNGFRLGAVRLEGVRLIDNVHL